MWWCILDKILLRPKRVRAYGNIANSGDKPSDYKLHGCSLISETDIINGWDQPVFIIRNDFIYERFYYDKSRQYLVMEFVHSIGDFSFDGQNLKTVINDTYKYFCFSPVCQCLYLTTENKPCPGPGPGPEPEGLNISNVYINGSNKMFTIELNKDETWENVFECVTSVYVSDSDLCIDSDKVVLFTSDNNNLILEDEN